MIPSAEMIGLYKTFSNLIKENPILSRVEEIYIFNKIYSLRRSQLEIFLKESSIENYFKEVIKKAIHEKRSDLVLSYSPEIWIDNYVNTNNTNLEILATYDIPSILKLIHENNINTTLYDDLSTLYIDLKISDIKYSIIHNYEKRFKNKLVNSNLRLILDIIGKLKPNDFLEKYDLFQEGIIAIERSIRNYDINMGLRFSTHAYNWIYSLITRAIDENSHTISIPVNRLALRREVYRSQNKFVQLFGYEPSEEELKEFNLEFKDISVLPMTKETDYVDLDAPDENTKSIFETIKDERILDQSDIVLRRQISEIVNNTIDSFEDPFQEYIIRYSTGMNDDNLVLKNIEIMKDLHISQNEFNSLRKKAINYIKTKLNSNAVLKDWANIPTEWDQGLNQN